MLNIYPKYYKYIEVLEGKLEWYSTQMEVDWNLPSIQREYV